MEQIRLESIHAQIATRAYERGEMRGRPIGSPREDWFRAEEALRLFLDVQRPPFSSMSMEAPTG